MMMMLFVLFHVIKLTIGKSLVLESVQWEGKGVRKLESLSKSGLGKPYHASL